jgi:hypothetical protein
MPHFGSSNGAKPGCGPFAGLLVGVLFFALIIFGLHEWQMSYCGPIQAAARDGDLPEIRRLLGSGVPVDARCKFRNWTALHAATDAGQIEAVSLLLTEHASVNPRDDDGYTPLALTGQQPNGRSHSNRPNRNAMQSPSYC